VTEEVVEERRRRSFERLFRDTRADLLAYLLRRTESPEEAADLLAETYLIAWTKLDVLPGGAQRRPYLFGVARKLLLKRATRRRSHGLLVERLAGELRAAGSFQLVREDDHSLLRSALAKLPEIDREILMLSAWDGLAPMEIAGVVGASANTVRVRLHRARARLRGELGLPEPPSLTLRNPDRSEAGAEDGRPDPTRLRDVPSRLDRRVFPPIRVEGGHRKG
jgi:RNA polymerase sigma-70 factor (ECF subfamily)